jgi:hypothetical protein
MQCLTLYSARNSASALAKRRSSHESSNAVRNGSLEERQMRDGLANAL